MESSRFSLILATCLAVISGARATTVSLSAELDTLNVGATYKATLSLTDYTPMDVIDWSKELEGKESVKIGQNINKDDLAPERYDFSLEEIDASAGKYDITLTIQGVQLEDAGVFRATLNDQVYDTSLVITVPPASLGFYFDDVEVEEGETKEIDPGSLHALRCEVRGAAPQAAVDVTSGGVSVLPNGFKTVDTANVVDGATDGFFQTTYDTVVRGDDVVFGATYANKEVACSAAGLRAAFRTKFPGVAPVFSADCPTEVTSFVGDKGFNLTCSLTADPPADLAVEWHYRNPHTADVIKVAETTDAADMPAHYGAKFEQVTADSQRAVLFIHRMKPQMFRNYTFIAANDLGNATHTVLLRRDVSQEEDQTAAASALSLSLSLLALLLLAH